MSANSIKTKLAVVSIIERYGFSLKKEKDLYRNITKYKASLATVLPLNHTEQIESYRESINSCRKALRIKRQEKFLVNVFLKDFNKDFIVEGYLDHEGNSTQNLKKMLKECTNKAITQARKGRQNRLSIQSGLGGMTFQKMGTVYADEGTILKAHIKKNIKNVYEGKTPTLDRKYIGIEIEFCAPIKEDQLVVKLFQNGIHKFAQLKEDGSLRPKDRERGYELAVLLEETTYKKGLKKITDLLASIKATVKDRRCGLHVHIDMRRRNKELVFNNLVACQYALLSIVDPIRYNNEFCQVVHTRKFPTEFTGDRQERYKTINAAAYYKYRTLEVRMHEGSIDFKEITNWVDLLIKISNYSKRLKNDVTKLPVLQSRLKLKKKLYDYTIERSCSWQVQNSDHVRIMRDDMESLTVRRPGASAILENGMRHTIPISATFAASSSQTVPIYGNTPGSVWTTSAAFLQDVPGTTTVNLALDNRPDVGQSDIEER